MPEIIASEQRFGYLRRRMGGAGARVLSSALGIAIAAVTWSVVFGADGVSRLLDLQAKRQELGAATVLRMQENEALRSEIDKLRENAGHLEALARRQLGLVRPDEVVYRFGRHAGTPPR